MGYLPTKLKALTFIYFLYSFGSIIPALSMTIRRLRDVGKPWQKYIFYFLIPGIGSIYLLYFLTKPTKSEAGEAKELIFEEAIEFIGSLFEERLINKMEFKRLSNFILLESEETLLESNEKIHKNKFEDWIKQLIDPQNKKKLIDARSKFFEGTLDKQEYDFLRAEILGI